MSGWRVLDLTGADGSIGYRDGSLVVSTARTPVPVLVGVVDAAVVLVGTTVTISAEAVTAVAGKGASIVVCDWKDEPVAALSPWSTRGSTPACTAFSHSSTTKAGVGRNHSVQDKRAVVGIADAGARGRGGSKVHVGKGLLRGHVQYGIRCGCVLLETV